MGPGMGVYRLFAPEGMTEAFGGMYTKPAEQPGPPAWLPYIKVASVPAATEAAKKLGAFIMHGPADVPGGKITMATDPQGAMFAVHEVTGAANPPKRAAKKRASAGGKAVAKKKSAVKKKKKAAPRRKKAGSKK
jgi:predicted enzyme related to lactoylglutathione lyase